MNAKGWRAKGILLPIPLPIFPACEAFKPPHLSQHIELFAYFW
jgi:hypothetical protein